MDYYTYINNLDLDSENRYSSPETLSPWPLTFQNKSIQYNTNKLIDMIRTSINDEMKDELEYGNLLLNAPNEKAKNIIKDIQENENIHNKILRKMFLELTGVSQTEQMSMSNYANKTFSYYEMLENAFMGELKAIEKYREMLAYAPNKEIYSMIMYILTDEIRHAIKYQYLMVNKEK